jgi:hypothetical protein
VVVEVIDQSQFFGGIVVQVAQGPADVGEALLLDPGVVVLAIRPGPGEDDVLLLGVTVELVADEGVIVV